MAWSLSRHQRAACARVRKSSASAPATAVRQLASTAAFTSTEMGTATRILSQCIARCAELGLVVELLGVKLSNEYDSHSWCSAPSGFTLTRSTSFSGLWA